MTINEKKELIKMKEKWIKDTTDFYKKMEDYDVGYIKNYPQYLPDFEQFIFDMKDIEFANDEE